MNKSRLAMMCLLCTAPFALGLGYHPQEDLGKDLANITTGFSPHPPESTVVGIQWLHYQNWYVTATVIAPNYIITVAHWNGSDGADPKWPIGYHLKKIGNENLGGKEYIIIDARAPFNVRMPQGRVPSPDLMICRVKRTDPADPNSSPEKYASLADANFSKWISFYEGDGEVGQTMTAATFGKIESSDRSWCSVSKEQQSAIPQLRGPGTLHWGRNIVERVDDHHLWCLYDSPGSPKYVNYECYASFGNSGSPIFIQDKDTWLLAGLFTSCTGGPRISQNIQWLNRQILDMEGGQTPMSESSKKTQP